VQGLSLEEIRREINMRYSKMVSGVDVTPVLAQRAPRYVYVLGEVGRPGRIELTGPTTVMQAIAMAGSWNIGAKIRQIVILRRDENWELMATKVNLNLALYGIEPCPTGELWIRDSDIIIVPKSILQFANERIEQIFTRGVYAVFPIRFNYSWTDLSTVQ
jgi:polysaccharide export outer membrane protein